MRRILSLLLAGGSCVGIAIAQPHSTTFKNLLIDALQGNILPSFVRDLGSGKGLVIQ